MNELVPKEKLWSLYDKAFSLMGHTMSGQLHVPIALFPKSYPRHSSARRLVVPHIHFRQFREKESPDCTENRVAILKLSCP